MTARMPSPQCRTVLRHLYRFLAPLISHPWGCCFHITTLLPATGPATACVCVCALGLGAEGDGRNHRPLPSVPPTHDSTIAAHRHIDTSTHRQIDSDLCPRRRRLRGCRSAEVRGAPVVEHQNPAVRPARIPTQRPAAAATNARRLPPRRREPAAEKRWIHRLPAAAAPKRCRPLHREPMRRLSRILRARTRSTRS